MLSSSGSPFVQDAWDPFPIVHRTKTVQRTLVARVALQWLAVQAARGVRGVIMIDIDDTLIDGKESVTNGFDAMRKFYVAAHERFPIHVVTARPDDDHRQVLKMLTKRGLCIPPDRLHMLPAKLYGGDLRHVEEFKWRVCQRIRDEHGGIVIARLGDKMWDVAHPETIAALDTTVHDRDCVVFFDARQSGTLCCKLPGSS